MSHPFGSLQFVGAAKTVTGSKSLLTMNGKKILIDCGLFQGPKAIRQRNWHNFERAKDLDAVILTHAHVDHSGYLPKLVKEGFTGPIYCSSGTKDLCEIILPDSAHLQEEDAHFANKTKHSKHKPALPLYRVEDAYQALSQFHVLKKDDWIDIFPGISVRLIRSGHILGSTFVQISNKDDYNKKIITFSGDLGNGRQHVIKSPVALTETDYLVMEGTYGDRLQSKTDPLEPLAEYINHVAQNNSVLVIPSFAIGRTQEILYLLRKLESENKTPEIPVFLDSPMAIDATDTYLKHSDELKLSMIDGQLSEPICTHGYTSVRSVEDSKQLCQRSGPMVVISAAGMLSGGRILHHLKARLPDPNNIVLFVGWQAAETKGRLLLQGLPKIRIHHEEVAVKAQIAVIDSLSAHADSDDILQWMQNFKVPPKQVFLNHGEESALNALKYRLQHELKIQAIIPDHEQEFELN